MKNPDKVFFPRDGLTKADVVEYYERIAGVMLPHVRDRPITLQRFPDGIDEKGFYQKEIPEGLPDWIERVDIDLREDGTNTQVVIQDAATLAYLAEQGCITPHIWLSRKDSLNHPDRLVFDLDPPDGGFDPIRDAARAVCDLLARVGLQPFVMTTGSRGLHVVTPLDGSEDFDEVRHFARHLCEELVHEEPDRFTTEMRKVDRGDRVFLDYLRNAYGQTTVAPYALRPKDGAPVATPLDRDELTNTDLDAQRYTIDNIFRRLGKKEDPWKNIDRHRRSLADARAELSAVTSGE